MIKMKISKFDEDTEFAADVLDSYVKKIKEYNKTKKRYY